MNPLLRDTSTWEPGFQEIFDLSLDLLCIGGLDGYFKRVNPAFEQAFGYSSQELLSRPFLDFVHPKDRARSGDALEVLTHGREVVRFENRNICADGSTLWLEWSARPVPGERVFYGAARDVTDRKRAETRLRKAQETVEASHEELRLHVEEQAALRRVATLVAQGVSSSNVLDAVAAEVAVLLSAGWASLARYEPDGAVTVLASRGEMGQTPVGLRVTLEGDSVAGSVLRTGRPARMEGYEDAPGSAAALGREMGVRAAVGAPIIVEGRLWGAIIATWNQEPLPGDDAEGRMANFTELVGTAIANSENRAELDASRARIVATADATRRRIERDLHDGAQQRLVSLALETRAAQATVPPELGEVRAELSHVAEGLTGVVDGLREIALGIHPAILAEGGLGPALRTLARRSAVAVELDLRGDEARLPEPVEVAAYYVVSEALTNAAKHAHASVVHVDVEAQVDILCVSVRDDGDGGADPARGSGLLGLKDRAEAIGGRISLESPRGRGTRIAVELPLAARDE